MTIGLNTAIFTVIIIWIFILTVFLWRSINHYNNLVKGSQTGRLQDILEAIFSDQKKNSLLLSDLKKKISYIETDSRNHIQKIGIVRFNPFSDTGGSQSFSIAILNGLGDGVVMTSLYGRTGNRWYIKEIKEYKSVSIELSKEEHQAIQKAIKKETSNERNKI